MIKPDKIVKNMLPDIDIESKSLFGFGRKEETKLPHKCLKCGGELYLGKYMYHKGNYFHKECFGKKRC